MINTVKIQIRANARPIITIEKSGAGTYQNSLTFEITDPNGNRVMGNANDSWLNYASANYTYHAGNYTVQIHTDNDYPGEISDGYIASGWGYEPDNYFVMIHLVVRDYSMYFQNCVYDRTQSDIDYLKELRSKWFNGTITEAEINILNNGELKGALNDIDLMRIEYNITYLADKLGLSIITAYDRESETFDIPNMFSTTYFSTLRDNLLAIYNTNRHYSSTPQVPDRPFNTYQKLNDIERILYDTYCSLQDYSYTSELYGYREDLVPEGDVLPVPDAI